MFLSEDLCMTRFGRLASPGQSDREVRTFGPQPPPVLIRSGRLSIASENFLLVDVPQARPSQFSESVICQRSREYPTVCRMPVRLAGIAPLPSHLVVYAQFPERRKLSPNLLPLLPVDLSDASAQPFIGASDEFCHRRRREIVDPATDESLQLPPVLFKASASTAQSNQRIGFQLLSAYASRRTLCFWL